MSTTAWRSPNWDQFQFGRNCEVYGAWLAAYGTPDVWNEEEGWALGANFMRSINLLRASLPRGWMLPTSEQGAQWWVRAYMVDFDISLCSPVVLDTESCSIWFQNRQAMEYFLFTVPSQECPVEFCKAFARTGNPDLAGLGVTISYLLEAALVSLFFLAFMIDLFRHKRWHRVDSANNALPPPYPASGVDYVIDIFRHSVKVFFDSAAFLCMAMLVAAIYTASEAMAFRERERNTKAYIYVLSNFYDVKLALLSSLFCIFPVAILSLINDQGTRRKAIRLVLLVIAYGMCIALVYVSPKAEWDSGLQNVVQIACDQRGGAKYWEGLVALQGLIIGLPALAIILTMVIMNPLHLASLNGSERLTSCRRWWPATLGSLSLVAMWAFLGCFLDLRTRIQQAAGSTDKTDVMSFGQVLALFAWAPVLLTLACHLLRGPKRAYNYELAMGYEVVSDEEKARQTMPVLVEAVMPMPSGHGR